MEPRIASSLVWLRAAVVATLGFVLGVAGHVTADGLLPGPMVLAALLGVGWVVSARLLVRPASTTRLVGLLVGGQFAFHAVLSATAGHRSTGSTAASPLPAPPPISPPPLRLPEVDGRRVGSLYDAYQSALPQSSSGELTLRVPHLVSDLAAHAPMMAVHVLAAAVVGWWLASGETALWTLLTLLGHRLVGACTLRTPVLPATGPAPVMPASPPAPNSLLLTRAHARRGPPVLAY